MDAGNSVGLPASQREKDNLAHSGLYSWGANFPENSQDSGNFILEW